MNELAYLNVILARKSMHTICGNADRIEESTLSGTVHVARLPQSYWNEPYTNSGYESLTFLLH